MWGCDQPAEEWGAHRIQVLRTDYNESLAATVELSFASPTLLGLGPKARDLLSVIASFPQGLTCSPSHTRWGGGLRQVLRSFSDKLEQRARHDTHATPRLSLSLVPQVIPAPFHNQGIFLHPDGSHYRSKQAQLRGITVDRVGG